METRQLGQTTLTVTRLGLGLAALGRPGYITLQHADDLNRDYDVAAMEAHAHAVLDAAYAGGVRYFDAARSYGRAEVFLGHWLAERGLQPGDVTVGSKWGYTYTADWQVDAEVHEVKEHSLAVLQRQWAETLDALGARRLGLYQVHSATLKSGVLENAPVLAKLAQLKETGIAIGLTVSGSNQAETVRRAIPIERDGVRLFDSVQATWNLLERSTGPALAEAADAGMGVLVKEALANGRLTPRNDEPDFSDKLARLREQADRLATTIDALALAAVLAQPWTTLVLSGAAQVDHMTSNLAAVDVAWDAEADAALAGLVASPEAYWSRRDELAWK